MGRGDEMRINALLFFLKDERFIKYLYFIFIRRTATAAGLNGKKRTFSRLR